MRGSKEDSMRRTVLVLLVAFVFLFAVSVQATTNCTTFYNHSGQIPGSYAYAELHEDDPLVDLTVQTNGQNIYVNPADYGAGSNWDRVKKCVQATTTTTTTIPSSSTTTMPTTTSSTTTTSSVPEESTTTTSTTTTSVPATTTSAPTTTTSIQATTTSTGPTGSTLPFTGPGEWSGLGIAGIALLSLGYLLVRSQRTD